MDLQSDASLKSGPSLSGRGGFISSVAVLLCADRRSVHCDRSLKLAVFYAAPELARRCSCELTTIAIILQALLSACFSPGSDVD